MRYHKVRPNSYAWLKWIYLAYVILTGVFIALYIITGKTYALSVVVAMAVAGIIFFVTVRKKLVRNKSISDMIHRHITENALCQTETAGNKKRYVFYPKTFWRIDEPANTLFIRFRLSGNKVNLRGLEQGLSDRLERICLNIYEKRGYIEYLFELEEEKQLVISSADDIKGEFGNREIPLSPSFVWDYRKTPHCLISGTTGSGKTTFCKFLISSLVNRGVRIVYLDVKGDVDMERFCRENPMVKYAREPERVAEAIDEVADEFQKRAGDIEEIGAGEEFDYGFNPIFIVCDEIILMKLILPKKIYDDAIKKINAVIVGGRSKAIYCGMVTQSAMAEYFGNSGIRGNIGLRVALGQMSPTEYGMIFGNEFSDVKNLRYGEVGSGLIMRDRVDSRPREFVAPYIKDGALNKLHNML